MSTPPVWQTAALAALSIWSILPGDKAAARELYNHDTGKAAIPLSPAHQQCNVDVFGGRILAETTLPQLRDSPDKLAAANERLFNCLRSYGQATSAAMMIVPIDRNNPQACKVFLYTITPPAEPDAAHRVGRQVLDCTSSRKNNNPFGPDPLGVYNIDAIWPAEGAALPDFLQKELGPTPQRVAGYNSPAFIEFDRDANGAARGLHGYQDLNKLGGSIGCIRMLPPQANMLLKTMQDLTTAWGQALPMGWYRTMPIFFVDHTLIKNPQAGIAPPATTDTPVTAQPATEDRAALLAAQMRLEQQHR